MVHNIHLYGYYTVLFVLHEEDNDVFFLYTTACAYILCRVFQYIVLCGANIARVDFCIFFFQLPVPNTRQLLEGNPL